MDAFATHHPHKVHLRPRTLGRGIDVPFVQGTMAALPVSLLLWIVLIWTAVRFFRFDSLPLQLQRPCRARTHAPIRAYHGLETAPSRRLRSSIGADAQMDRGIDPQPVLEQIRRVRQARQYKSDPVPQEVLDQLLEIARWTSSARNTQPWHFIVISDKEQLRQISQVRTPINWVADAPLAIAIVLDGKSRETEAYDEGRVTERVLIAARLLGLGGGTAWFGDDAQEAQAKQILGIPAERTARSVITLGYPITFKDPRPNAVTGGRKPLAEIVSTGRYIGS